MGKIAPHLLRTQLVEDGANLLAEDLHLVLLAGRGLGLLGPGFPRVLGLAQLDVLPGGERYHLPRTLPAGLLPPAVTAPVSRCSSAVCYVV